MKKTLSLIIAILILFSLAAGCQNNAGNPSSAPSTQPVSQSPSSAPSDTDDEPASKLPLVNEHTSFTMWCSRTFSVQSGLTQWSDADVFKELERLTNVKAETQHPSGGTSTASLEQFNLIITSGEYPDVFFGGTWQGGYDRYIEDDVILELSDLLQSHGPDILANMDMSEVLRRACVTDSGKKPMIPVVQYQSKTGPTAGLCIREDWLNELGIAKSSIETYDDLRGVLDQMKSAYGLQYPFGFASIADVFYGNVSRVYAYGFNAAPAFIYDGDGNMCYGPIQQEYRDFLITYNGLVKDGYIDPAVENLRRADIESEWYNDKIGFGFGMAYYIGGIAAEKGMSLDPDFAIAAIDEPKFKKGMELHTGEYHQYNAANYTLNSNITITTSCKQPELVMSWFNYCFTEDGKLLTNYGFEGDTFTYVNGAPLWTDKIANNPDMDLGATQQRYLWHFPPFVIFDKEIDTYPDARQREAVEIWQSSSDHAWCLPLGYTYTADESVEYTAIYGDLATYMLECTSRFMVGIEDPNDDAAWNAYVNQTVSMKLDRLLEIVDAACDRYYQR